MKSRTIDYTLVLKLLAPILLLLALAVYYLAARPTYAVYRQYREQCGSEQLNASLSVSPGYTAKRIHQVDKLYRRYQIDTLSWKNELWNAASGLSAKHHCNITAYPGVKKALFNDQNLFIQRIAFSGQYAGLMRLLQEAENLKHFGVVTSIRLSRKPRTDYTSLQVDFTGIHEQLTHLP